MSGYCGAGPIPSWAHALPSEAFSRLGPMAGTHETRRARVSLRALGVQQCPWLAGSAQIASLLPVFAWSKEVLEKLLIRSRRSCNQFLREERQ